MTALAGMGQLMSFNLQRTGLLDLTFVSNHPLLRSLTVSNNSIGDATPLLGLAGLASLAIGGNPILCTDPVLATLAANGVSIAC